MNDFIKEWIKIETLNSPKDIRQSKTTMKYNRKLLLSENIKYIWWTCDNWLNFGEAKFETALLKNKLKRSQTNTERRNFCSKKDTLKAILQIVCSGYCRIVQWQSWGNAVYLLLWLLLYWVCTFYLNSFFSNGIHMMFNFSSWSF